MFIDSVANHYLKINNKALTCAKTVDMVKRKAETPKDVPVKLPKVIDRRTETITSAAQLQKILTFRETDIERFKTGSKICSGHRNVRKAHTV